MFVFEYIYYQLAVGHVAVQGHDSSAAKYNLQFLKMFLNGFAFSFFSPFTFSSPHLTFSFYTLQPFHILRFIIILSSDYHRLNKMAAQSMIFFPCLTLPFLHKSLFIRSLSSLVTYFKKKLLLCLHVAHILHPLLSSMGYWAFVVVAVLCICLFMHKRGLSSNV